MSEQKLKQVVTVFTKDVKLGSFLGEEFFSLFFATVFTKDLSLREDLFPVSNKKVD